MLQKLLEWDRETLIYLNGLGVETYDTFWSIITNIATWIPLFVLFLVLLFRKFPRQEAVLKFLTLSGLIAFITSITFLTKTFMARLRPNNSEDINDLLRILKTPTDYSFFSGHASSSLAITMLMYLFLRKRVFWAPLFFIWPLLFSYSRIYVGVHYPTDIMVGALVGIASAIFFYFLYKQFIAPYSMSNHP
ncbi:phosphatase PAP2 family protein [Flagellimonas nanhaiensis]|uniref:Phosphatase PAP2 family protein n=1 Tax=Flagellimonas nanhaiensis TaxID=2292706 RepID=A0A371JM18_9FLAO|nr:phosphatase PAP2 family protein [Allomuricauda nanhaiensis]RDY58104.1 phosphatase PAP2 family protein [Allomuricauda nanhaiensis]